MNYCVNTDVGGVAFDFLCFTDIRTPNHESMLSSNSAHSSSGMASPLMAFE